MTDWLDVFLSKKANAQSRWGQGMELFSDETSSLASNTPAGNGDGNGDGGRQSLSRPGTQRAAFLSLFVVVLCPCAFFAFLIFDR